MATLLKVLNNLADIKSAGGVALRVRTQGEIGQRRGIRFAGLEGAYLDSPRLASVTSTEDLYTENPSKRRYATGEAVARDVEKGGAFRESNGEALTSRGLDGSLLGGRELRLRQMSTADMILFCARYPRQPIRI
jgi:hypothetical protein